MSLLITNVQEERQVTKYIEARNTPKNVMAYGVYPNCKKALEEYAYLLSRLEDHEDLGPYMQYHLVSTSPIQPYITQLQTAMQAIVTIMTNIDKYALSTTGGQVFGIPLEEEKTNGIE